MSRAGPKFSGKTLFLCLGLAIAGSLVAPASAQAEVFCLARSFVISGYVYGMPALENIVLENGTPLQNVSLCGTNCADKATEHRLALAMAAKSRGVPLRLFFGDRNACSEVDAFEKPFMMSMID